MPVPLPALPPPLRADVFPVEASSTVIISPDLFSEENGQIQYYGVIATTNESRKCPCVSQAAVAPWRAAGPLDVTLGLSLSPCTFPSSAEAHPGDHVQHVVRPLLRDRGLLPGSAHTQPLPSEELPRKLASAGGNRGVWPVQGNVQWEAERQRTVQVRHVSIPPEGKGLEEKKDCTCPCKVPPAPWMLPHPHTPKSPAGDPKGSPPNSVCGRQGLAGREY